MKFSNWVLMIAATVALGFGSADMADAKNKKKSGGKATGNVTRDVGHGNKVKVGNGKGAKSIPPGQIKRYTRGAKLPGDVRYDSISDLSKWKMKPLGAGEKYIRVDNEILRVSDTLKVLAVIGLVNELLK